MTPESLPLTTGVHHLPDNQSKSQMSSLLIMVQTSHPGSLEDGTNFYLRGKISEGLILEVMVCWTFNERIHLVRFRRGWILDANKAW